MQQFAKHTGIRQYFIHAENGSTFQAVTIDDSRRTVTVLSDQSSMVLSIGEDELCFAFGVVTDDNRVLLEAAFLFRRCGFAHSNAVECTLATFPRNACACVNYDLVEDDHCVICLASETTIMSYENRVRLCVLPGHSCRVVSRRRAPLICGPCQREGWTYTYDNGVTMCFNKLTSESREPRRLGG